MAKNIITARLEPKLIERLDAVAELLSQRAGGARVTRSSALGVVAERGIEQFEAEKTTRPAKKQKR